MKKVISEKYREQLKQLHEENKTFGVGNVTAKHYSKIAHLIKANKVESILDYGCGKGHFIQHFQDKFPELKLYGFDVANDEYPTLPNAPVDMVVCLDVMEHVEFAMITNVLSEIRSRTRTLFVCSVANYPAGKSLPDGRNAHVTQLPFSQWFSMLSMYFRVDKFQRTGKGEGLFYCSAMNVNSDWR